MARRRRRSRRTPPRDPRTGLFMRRNPSPKKKGAKKGGARKVKKGSVRKAGAVKKPTVAVAPKARKRRPGEPITGPRVTSVRGKRALTIPVTGTTKGGATRGFSGAVINNLEEGDRIIVWRDGHSMVQHSVGGVRPRNNPSKRRRRKARHNPGPRKRVVIKDRHGRVIKSFMARANPHKRRKGSRRRHY